MTDPDRIARLEVALNDCDSLSTLLTEGVFDVIEFLNRSDRDALEVAVIDIVVHSGSSSAPSTQAFIEAVRGLVQAVTLERESTSPATNIVVSNPEQRRERELTLAYLSDANGRFSRGTTYDLREVAA